MSQEFGELIASGKAKLAERREKERVEQEANTIIVNREITHRLSEEEGGGPF